MFFLLHSKKSLLFLFLFLYLSFFFFFFVILFTLDDTLETNILSPSFEKKSLHSFSSSFISLSLLLVLLLLLRNLLCIG